MIFNKLTMCFYAKHVSGAWLKSFKGHGVKRSRSYVRKCKCCNSGGIHSGGSPVYI